LLEIMGQYAERQQREFPDARRVFAAAAQRIRESRRLSIPGTLLISALSLIDDVGNCVTSDLKQAGNRVYFVGGLPQTDFPLAEAASVHAAVADALRRGLVAACHDSSDGGWLTALAEMAIAGNLGVELPTADNVRIAPFEQCCAGYVVESADAQALEELLSERKVRFDRIGSVCEDRVLRWIDQSEELAALRAAWAS